MILKFKLSILFIITLFFASCLNKHDFKENSTKLSIDTNKNVIPDFNIRFPKTEFAVEKTETINQELDNVLVTNWILQGDNKNGPFMYFVAHNKVPEKWQSMFKTNTQLLDVSLQAMLMGSATKLGGTDFIFTKIKYKNYEGIESICKVFDGNGIIKSRLYMINDNYFMISAGGQNINIDSVNNFLNSFKLKK